MYHSVTTQKFLVNLVTLSHLSLYQRIQIVQLSVQFTLFIYRLINETLLLIKKESNSSKYEKFVFFLIEVLRSQVIFDLVYDLGKL